MHVSCMLLVLLEILIDMHVSSMMHSLLMSIICMFYANNMAKHECMLTIMHISDMLIKAHAYIFFLN